MIHRDIKPSNILLNNFSCKFGDPGICIVIDRFFNSEINKKKQKFDKIDCIVLDKDILIDE